MDHIGQFSLFSVFLIYGVAGLIWGVRGMIWDKEIDIKVWEAWFVARKGAEWKTDTWFEV